MKHYDLVLFDFDGTLYDSEDHFNTYVDMICTHLDKSQAEQLRNNYTHTREGQGTLHVGEWYDPTTKTSKPFDGSKPTDVKYYLGDYWWIVHTLGHTLGATDQQLADSFLRTREYMMTHTDEIRLVLGLKEWLQTAHEKKDPITILATNSPEVDSVSILKQLEVHSYFSEVICNSRKPIHMREILEHVSTTYDVSPERMLCVGDHYYNDIEPAVLFGADTLFINRHHVSHPRKSTYEVSTSEALIVQLNQIHSS